MQRSPNIKRVTHLGQAISNPIAGDWIFLDIDETLLLTGIERYKESVHLTESNLAEDIKRLSERYIKVIGLTARHHQWASQTLEQLKQAGIELDEVLHAPNIHENGKIYPQKGSCLQSYLEKQKKHNKASPKRVFVFDDIYRNLEDIQKNCKLKEIPVFLKQYEQAHYQDVQCNDETAQLFPQSLDGFKVVQSLGGGSNSTFLIQNSASDRQYVLKFGVDEKSGKVEILCNAVYRAMGVAVPEMRVYNRMPKLLAKELKLHSPYGIFKVCKYLQETRLEHADKCKKVLKAAQNNFVAHVLLGNIDAAEQANFIVDDKGQVFLIDAGANFLFRALGEKRKEPPELASEIDTLRDSHFNWLGNQWFSSIDDQTIQKQIRRIVEGLREIEKVVWDVSDKINLPPYLRDCFLESLSDRLDILVSRYCPQPQRYAKADKKAHEKRTAAGVLTYCLKGDEPYILLSKRVRHEWWDNFGGKSDPEDRYISDTARREVAEESSGVFNFTDYELQNSPFHDLITGDGNQQFLYRMYLCKHNEADVSLIKDAEHTAHQWVPLQTVLHGLENSETVTVAGENTIIIEANNHEILLFPPLWRMLKQPQVYENLSRLLQEGKLEKTGTLSRVLRGCGTPIDFITDSVEDEALIYQPLRTPLKKRQEIACALLRKTHLLREFKATRYDNDCYPEIEVALLSQSEIHLKVMLGKQYRPGDVEYNVSQVIREHFSRGLSDESEEKLVRHCVRLIENEKQYGDERLFFYHGCNQEAAFAYDVYMAIYRAIKTNKKWHAFRADSIHLKKFNNIAEFITYYSKNDTSHIKNNDDHFHDCALSVNVFLFGNHFTPTSCSIAYMLQNDVRRQINLSSMFETVLRPFHVSPELIKKLTGLYERYAKNRKGSLYQISMSKSDACSMAYPAGFVGVMNALDGEMDLTVIMDALRGKVTSNEALSGQDANYIKALQARVMAPPSLDLRVDAFGLNSVTIDENREYQDTLGLWVDALLFQALTRADTVNPVIKGGIFKLLPSVYEENQLSYSTDFIHVLQEAISQNDLSTVSHMIGEMPGILDKNTKLYKKYIGNDINNNEIPDEISLFELIVMNSVLPLTVLGDELERIFSLKIKDSLALMDLLSKLPNEYRLNLAIARQDKILDGIELACVLEMLSEDARLTFAIANQDKIQNGDELESVLIRLPAEAHLAFATANQGKIENGVELLYLLSELPDEARLAFFASNQDKIQNGYALGSVLAWLPAETRLAFAMGCSHKIKDGNIKEIMSTLAPEECQIFNTWYKDKVRMVDELTTVFQRQRSLDPKTGKFTLFLKNRYVTEKTTDARQGRQFKCVIT